MLSLISVNYNKESVLQDFFDSIYSNGFDDFELIFIDDCSTDGSVNIARNYPCIIIRNEHNIGPAASRNIGSKIAKGSVLVFTDTDITIDPGGLALINKHFTQNKAKAMFGKLAFPPLRNTRIGRFWLYDEEEACHYGGVRTGMVNCWSSTLGAIDRELFLSFGGFNELFKGADIEDHELAAKILEHHQVYYDEKLTFHHCYPSTWLVIKKMFTRSKMFAGSKSIKVYRDKSWFSSHRNAGFLLSAVITFAVIFSAIGLFFFPAKASVIALSLVALVLIKVIHHRRMLRTVLGQEGFAFAAYVFFMQYLTSNSAIAGFASGLLSRKGHTDG
ncbi:MAG: hypothetical protein B1H09_07670 [Gemmatimonadaceae bacterium 4484_173]|nr:MAG: hypothetical protein B1H09_07670 [Gemmatimonadaceae bacterium 4484_173]